jgi:hypothetical protein
MIIINKTARIPIRSHGGILSVDFLGHKIKISIILVVVRIANVESSTADPPS